MWGKEQQGSRCHSHVDGVGFQASDDERDGGELLVWHLRGHGARRLCSGEDVIHEAQHRFCPGKGVEKA